MKTKNQVLNEEQKNTFLNLLLGMDEVKINEYIKANGKNNDKESVFLFHWENYNNHIDQEDN